MCDKGHQSANSPGARLGVEYIEGTTCSCRDREKLMMTVVGGCQEDEIVVAGTEELVMEVWVDQIEFSQ